MLLISRLAKWIGTREYVIFTTYSDVQIIMFWTCIVSSSSGIYFPVLGTYLPSCVGVASPSVNNNRPSSDRVVCKRMNNLEIHNDQPGHPSQRSQGDVGHVKPRIQAIERRIQLRTPERQRSDGNELQLRHSPITTPVSFSNDKGHTTNVTMMTLANINFEHRNKENNGGVVSLHSPILSSMYESNIKQFEADVLKRQAEYINRISDLEGRLAMFHSRLAIECAERGREQSFTVEVSSGLFIFCYGLH